MADISSLQQYINNNVNDVDGPCYSFVCIGIAGDCIVPKNVCIRFINCPELSGITAEGNNILNFDNCTFGKGQSYQFNDSVININNCSIESDISITSSKMYIANCSAIQGKIALEDNSYCKSHKNLYTTDGSSATAFSIDSDSKVESYKDGFHNYTGPVLNATNKSFIKVSDPDISAIGTLVNVDSFSKVEIYNLVGFQINPDNNLAIVNDNSTLKIHKIPTLNVSGTAFIVKNNSFCFLNDLGDVSSRDSFIQSSGSSTIEIIRANSITNNGSTYLFNCTESILNFYDVKAITSSASGCFNLVDTEVVCINNEKIGTIVANGGSIVISNANLNKAKLYFNTIDRISSSGIAFSIINSSLRLTNINTVESTGNIVTCTSTEVLNSAKIIFSDIGTLRSTGGSIVEASNKSKIFISGITTIIATGSAFSTNNQSSLYINTVNAISSSAGVVINAPITTCSLSNIKSCTGPNIVLSASSGEYADITSCNLTGGTQAVVLSYTKSKMTDVVVVGGIKIDGCDDVVLTHVSATDVIDVSGGSIVTTKNCTFDGKTQVLGSTIENRKSYYNGDVTLNLSTFSSFLSALKSFSQVSRSALINSLSDIVSDVALSNSSMLNLSSMYGAVSLTGKSTLIAGGVNSGNVNNGSDGSYTAPTGAFVVSDGILALSATNMIDVRSNIYKAKFRDYSITDITNKFTVTVGTSTIVVDTTSITETAKKVMQISTG